MLLYQKIMQIYPELTDDDFAPGGTIRLHNETDGPGEYIGQWNHPTLTKPTDEQLAGIV